jgi:hypothetical protein
MWFAQRFRRGSFLALLVTFTLPDIFKMAAHLFTFFIEIFTMSMDKIIEESCEVQETDTTAKGLRCHRLPA